MNKQAHYMIVWKSIKRLQPLVWGFHTFEEASTRWKQFPFIVRAMTKIVPGSRKDVKSET